MRDTANTIFQKYKPINLKSIESFKKIGHKEKVIDLGMDQE